MHSREEGARVDAFALAVAGLVNTVLAPLDFGLLLRPGSVPGEDDAGARAEWIAEHATRWQVGWTFWFVVTLTFAWSFYALGRHLAYWPALAVAVALLAAAVDLVGIVVNLAIVPELAAQADPAFASLRAAQDLGHALTGVAAFGLYTLAGLLLLPALFATAGYPRPLAWLGAAEWGVSAIATVLLAGDLPGANAVAGLGFLLFAPWVWLSAAWILRP